MTEPGEAGDGVSRPGESRPGGTRPGGTRPGESRPGDGQPGEGIVTVAWAAMAVFTVTAVGDRLGVDALELPATVTAVTLFAAGFVVWIAAFVRAVGRSRYDEITVPSLFFLAGSAPRAIQVRLLGAVAYSIAVAAGTASQAPFGVMVPVFPLALAGMWGARHGQFPPRRRRERGRRQPASEDAGDAR